MTIEEHTTVVDQTTTPQAPGTVSDQPATIQQRSTVVTRSGPSGGEFARRAVVFLFGIVQGLIVLRIVFLLLDAREANGIVSGILNVSQVFVGPFDGILNTNALAAGGSILDIAAIVAIVGWTVLELVVIAGIGIFRREPA
ncbi:MAG TPA: hypothetical protein VFJ00_04615 [Candidatus Limnocylindria bacterium]|nr:hypothetical protein [Candidatus Limnocylindria bacterium]